MRDKRTRWTSSTLDVSFWCYDEPLTEEEAGIPAATLHQSPNGPLIGSKLPYETGDWHAPVIDLDIPHRYVPSSTPGHGHLYLDVLLEWKDYLKLLEHLAYVGIVSHEWVEFARQNGMTLVRDPSIKKGQWAQMVVDALMPLMLGAEAEKPPVWGFDDDDDGF